MVITTEKHKVSRENIKPPPQGIILLKDWISELPREILVDILSQLEMKEAGRTSILSKRWRHTWTHISNLNFDASEVLVELMRKINGLEVERRNYVSWVNQVMECHQGQTIDQFVAMFHLDKSSGSYIDSWVSSAITKKVQRLKLDFTDVWGCSRKNHYSFPNSPEISSCKSLTSLHLAAVDITGEILQLFLYNCLNLESVFVRGSTTLVSLNVDGPPSLKLKWLELAFCKNIKSLNVSAPNLVSFKYDGPRIPMPLKDVPKLLEISLLGSYSYYLSQRLSEMSSYLAQLEKLSLEASTREEYMRAATYPVLPNLKHLTLIIATLGFKSIIDCASMINACPSLTKFSFEIWTDYFHYKEVKFEVEAYPPPKNIRVVEFNGFRGKALEIDLAKHFIKNAVMLEKITFDTVSPKTKGRWLEFIETEGRISARKCARDIGKTLPPGIELVIA